MNTNYSYLEIDLPLQTRPAFIQTVYMSTVITTTTTRIFMIFSHILLSVIFPESVFSNRSMQYDAKRREEKRIAKKNNLHREMHDENILKLSK